MKAIKFLMFFFLFGVLAFAQFNVRDTVSIEASQDTSYTFDLDGDKLAAIQFPSTFQGGTVAILTSDHPDSTFWKVQYDGSDISITATDGQQCGIKPVEANQLLRYIQIVSDSTETTGRLLWIVKTNF